MNKYSNILWDFDGVLMNSNHVRDLGFEDVLKTYPKEQVETLMQLHRQNGGLSRYVKFKFFFETIRNESLTSEKLNELCIRFSEIMRKKLVNSDLLIRDSLNYIRMNHEHCNMFIVSGSDEVELRYLCEQLGIGKYFKGIFGSPTLNQN